MNKIEVATQMNITAAGKAKCSDNEMLRELWSMKTRLNRMIEYDIVTLADRDSAMRMGFSAKHVKTPSTGRACSYIEPAP